MNYENLKTAAFGMGCFWGPDALFGAEEGVVRTRVGYAGGSKENPTYEKLGDHTETVLVEYDPGEISYEELLEIFWNNHGYDSKTRKKQYQSRIFYTNDEQERKAEEAKERKEKEGKVFTKIQELNFHVAEDYHQKYRLRHSKLMENFSKMSDEEFRDSPLAAKLNGFEAGHLDLEDLEELDLDVEPGLKDKVLNRARSMFK